VRSAAAAVQFVHRYVGDLVAQDFGEQRIRRLAQPARNADQLALGVAAPERAAHPRAEAD